MIKELMHDPIFLAGKSEVATKEDLQVAHDLLDTLMAPRESCVGMAANMIGVRKRIKRYKTIKVQYQTMEMQTRTKNFTGWTAQIIQHEVDHCEGILI